MANNGIELRSDEVRTLAFGSIGASFTIIGTAIDRPTRLLLTQNLTDQTLMFSFTGTTDHFALPANGFLLIDIATNQTNTQGFYVSVRSRISVRHIGVAPTSGAVYVTAMHGRGD